MNNMYYFTTDEVLEGDFDAYDHPFDALSHASGPWLYRMSREGRQFDATGIDATELLREFARWCALQAIDEWDAPDVVCNYLETGDESLREEVKALAKARAWNGVAAARAAELATRAAGWKRDGWGDMWDRAEMATARTTAREAAKALAEGPTLAAMVVDLKQRAKFKQLVDKAFGE